MENEIWISKYIRSYWDNLEDFISPKCDGIQITKKHDWPYALVKNWNFIGYKRTPMEVAECRKTTEVCFSDTTFENCTFKDVVFKGRSPFTDCIFKKCKFENCVIEGVVAETKFNSCTFTSCIFTGSFYKTIISESCVLDKVLWYSTFPIPSILKKAGAGITLPYKCGVSFKVECLGSEKDELIEYFWPKNFEIPEPYKIGNKFLRPFFYYLDDEEKIKVIQQGYYVFNGETYKIQTINGKLYFEDVVKYIGYYNTWDTVDCVVVGEKYWERLHNCRPFIL